MRELMKTKRLLIVVAAIVLILVLGVITLRKPDVKYALSPAESLALLADTSHMVTPLEAAGLLASNNGKTLFVDVRSSVAFDKSHVKDAINIPVRELFTKKSKELFRDMNKAGQTAILYGETQQQANGPWFMLQQTGYKHIKLFTGAYIQLDLAHADSLTKLLPQLSETTRIDTVALKALTAPAQIGNNATTEVKKVKKAVAPVKHEPSSGGGC